MKNKNMKKGFVEVTVLIFIAVSGIVWFEAVENLNSNEQSKQYKKSDKEIVASMIKDAEKTIKKLKKEVYKND